MQSIESTLAFLKALARISLRHFLVLAAAAIVGVAIGAGLILSHPPLYATSMTVQGIAGQTVASQTPQSVQAQAIAAMMGPMPGYLALIQSRDIAQLLIDREHFDRTLFPGEVDPRTGAWTKPPGLLDRLFHTPRSAGPTADDVQRAVAGLLAIDRDAFGNVVTLHCASPSRTLCAALLAALHRQTELHLRELMRAQAVQTRDRAAGALQRTTDPGQRAALTATLQKANAAIAAADLGEPVAARVLAAPQVPVAPLPRHLALLLTAAALMGLAAGMAIAWTIEARRGRAQ